MLRNLYLSSCFPLLNQNEVYHYVRNRWRYGVPELVQRLSRFSAFTFKSFVFLIFVKPSIKIIRYDLHHNSMKMYTIVFLYKPYLVRGHRSRKKYPAYPNWTYWQTFFTHRQRSEFIHHLQYAKLRDQNTNFGLELWFSHSSSLHSWFYRSSGCLVDFAFMNNKHITRESMKFLEKKGIQVAKSKKPNRLRIKPNTST